MTVYYVDYEGAQGSGDGSSFANRAGRVVDLFPNSSSTRASAGDVIRVKQSPNPTILTTSGKVDHCPSHYSYSISSKSYSSDIVWSTTEGQTKIELTTGYKTGDRVMIWDNQQNASSAAPAGKNISGIWTLTSHADDDNWFYLDGFTAANTNAESGNYKPKPYTAETVKLSGTLPWKNIACHEMQRAAWTAETNTTAEYLIQWSDWNTTHQWLNPTGGDRITIGSSASVGKAAYFATGTLDLSGYQQISFRVRYEGCTRSEAPPFSLRLCTDTTGDTSVHTVEFTPNYFWSDGWDAVVKDFGTNLNSSIKSVAIYCDTAGTQQKIILSNIVACKASSAADSVTHKSLIGLNTADDPVWYPVQDLDPRGHISLIYDCISRRSGVGRGYYGMVGCYFSASSNSATIYKREPITPKYVSDYNLTGDSTKFEDLTWVNNTYDAANFTTASSGGLVSCGWNSTDMSTQVGHTFVRGNGRGYGLYSGNSNVQVERWHGTSFYRGIDFHGDGVWADDIGCSDTYQKCVSIMSCKNARKMNIKYAFANYAGQYNVGCLTVSGQDNLDFNHSSSATADFNLGWANGAISNNTYAVRFQTCHNMRWNKVNVLFTHRNIDIGYNIKNCSWEEWRTGGHTHSYGTKFEDSGQANTSNNKIKKLIIEGSSAGLMLSNCSVGNHIDVLEAKTGDEYPWCIKPSDYSTNGSTNAAYRFNRIWWIQSGAIQFASGNAKEFTVNGGHTEGKIAIGNGNTFKSDNLVFDIYNSGTEFSLGSGSKALNKDYDGTSGAILNLLNSTTQKVTPQTAIRKTASGYALKLEGAWNEDVKHDVTQIIVNSGSQVTVTVWAYRETGLTDATPDWGLSVELKILQNSEIGLNADVVNTIPPGNSYTQAWHQLQCQFTPTASGPATIQFRRWSNDGSNAGYAVFDDLAVSQA